MIYIEKKIKHSNYICLDHIRSEYIPARSKAATREMASHASNRLFQT